MAYALIANPTHSTLPQFIIDFAVQNVGWLAAGANRIAAPGADAGITFQIQSEVAATPYQNRLAARLMSGETQLQYTACCAPYQNRQSDAPTRMHLFGGLTPQPFIAAVVEYQPGYFRHLYLGYMEKLGNYTGGEVLCGSTHFISGNGIHYDYNDHHYLFNGLQNRWVANESGGVRLSHAALGGTILAPFRAAGSRDTTASNVTENCVIGGFRDNINDQQIARGSNTFAGVQIFNPVNLYVTRAQSRYCPIGRPAGVRMVNMTSLDPAAPIVVGNKRWRCFPQFRKTENITLPNHSSSTLMTGETSYIIGYAYLEGDA